MKKEQVLEIFGQELIQEVRDYALSQFKNTIEGEANTKERKKIKEAYRNLSGEDKELLNRMVFDSVDRTIHYFLWMFERSDNFKIHFVDGSNLAELSDGLSGELYTDDGWIKKFSNYQSSERSQEVKESIVDEIVDSFNRTPEEAKRIFILTLNNKEKFNAFKLIIPNIPPNILESLIEMTLSRSSFHKEECEEIKKIMREKS